MDKNIIVIFSRHEEGGKCTSGALVQIMTYVKPDIIFEELSHSLYNEAYIDKTLNNLESVAIRKYLEDHHTKHIPVDTYDRPEHYQRDQDTLWKRLIGGINQYSFHLISLSKQLPEVISRGGFEFLNSEKNEQLFEELESLKRSALEVLNDEKLYQLSRLDKEVIEKREDTILDNIYRYREEHDFDNGLMLIGSGHMKSIKQKIQERETKEDLTINWCYFSDLKSEIEI